MKKKRKAKTNKETNNGADNDKRIRKNCEVTKRKIYEETN